MLRVYYDDDSEEISHTANDLRIVIRKCIKNWQATLTQKQCQLSIDLNTSMPVLCQAEDTHSLINGLLELAISRLSEQGELSIVSCRGAGVVELEVADSGATVPCEARFDRLTFPPRNLAHDRQLVLLQTLALSFGGRIWAAPCPQGGMAWTLRLPGRVATKRAA
jgi:hypothetical protein